MIELCESCNTMKNSTVSAVVQGKYYKHICKPCLSQHNTGISSINAQHERNRQYEDYADETIQPYTASGPNPEFYRLYPRQAQKIFTSDELAQVRRKI